MFFSGLAAVRDVLVTQLYQPIMAFALIAVCKNVLWVQLDASTVGLGKAFSVERDGAEEERLVSHEILSMRIDASEDRLYGLQIFSNQGKSSHLLRQWPFHNYVRARAAIQDRVELQFVGSAVLHRLT